MKFFCDLLGYVLVNVKGMSVFSSDVEAASFSSIDIESTESDSVLEAASPSEARSLKQNDKIKQQMNQHKIRHAYR